MLYKTIALQHLNTFLALTRVQLMLFKETVVGKIVNLYIWVTTTLLVSTYLLPKFGMTTEFGVFMVPSIIATAGLFEIYPRVVALVHDFEGDRTIFYHLALPLPSILFFAHLVLVQTLTCTLISVAVLPLAKLILWHYFDLRAVQWFRLLIALIVINFFYSSFALWLTSKIKNIFSIEDAWSRFLYPLWYLGGYQFSWYALYATAPYVAYANLLNPLVYVMEIIRSSLLGPEGFLPFWRSICALIMVSILCAWRSFKALKRRLDFV